MIANGTLLDIQQREQAYSQPAAQPLDPPLVELGQGREPGGDVAVMMIVGGATLGVAMCMGLMKLVRAVKGIA